MAHFIKSQSRVLFNRAHFVQHNIYPLGSESVGEEEGGEGGSGGG